MKSETLKEGVDFYFDESRLMVLTEKYLLARGFCCGKGCRHCPYNFQNVTENRKDGSSFNRQNHNGKK